MTDNRISLQKLDVFCRVVECGGVRRAAEQLFVSQPVVSGHVKSLEERLGTVLFQRDGRALVLTEAGGVVYRWASEVLRGRVDVEKELDDLATGSAGSVSIGSSMTVGNTILTPIILDFRRTAPLAHIRLEMTPVETALADVREGRHDFAAVAADHVDELGELDARLLHQPRWAIVTAALDQTTPERVSPDQLAELPFVSPPSGLTIRRSQDIALGRLGVGHRHVAIELGSAESIKRGVAEGLGVALLWHAAVEAEIESGLLREVAVDAPELRDNLFIVRRRSHQLSPLQQRAMQFIVTALKARFDGR